MNYHSIKNRLIDYTIIDIEADDYGVLYYATQHGLGIDDGEKYRIVKIIDKTDHPTGKESRISCIKVYNNKVYIGTYKSGLFIYDHGNISPVKTINDKIPYCINNIDILDSHICISTERGIFTISEGGLLTPKLDLALWKNSNIINVCNDGYGVWIFTKNEGTYYQRYLRSIRIGKHIIKGTTISYMRNVDGSILLITTAGLYKIVKQNKEFYITKIQSKNDKINITYPTNNGEVKVVGKKHFYDLIGDSLVVDSSIKKPPYIVNDYIKYKNKIYFATKHDGIIILKDRSIKNIVFDPNTFGEINKIFNNDYSRYYATSKGLFRHPQKFQINDALTKNKIEKIDTIAIYDVAVLKKIKTTPVYILTKKGVKTLKGYLEKKPPVIKGSFKNIRPSWDNLNFYATKNNNEIIKLNLASKAISTTGLKTIDFSSFLSTIDENYIYAKNQAGDIVKINAKSYEQTILVKHDTISSNYLSANQNKLLIATNRGLYTYSKNTNSNNFSLKEYSWSAIKNRYIYFVYHHTEFKIIGLKNQLLVIEKSSQLFEEPKSSHCKYFDNENGLEKLNKFKINIITEDKKILFYDKHQLSWMDKPNKNNMLSKFEISEVLIDEQNQPIKGYYTIERNQKISFIIKKEVDNSYTTNTVHYRINNDPWKKMYKDSFTINELKSGKHKIQFKFKQFEKLEKKLITIVEVKIPFFESNLFTWICVFFILILFVLMLIIQQKGIKRNQKQKQKFIERKVIKSKTENISLNRKVNKVKDVVLNEITHLYKICFKDKETKRIIIFDLESEQLKRNRFWAAAIARDFKPRDANFNFYRCIQYAISKKRLKFNILKINYINSFNGMIPMYGDITMTREIIGILFKYLDLDLINNQTIFNDIILNNNNIVDFHLYTSTINRHLAKTIKHQDIQKQEKTNTVLSDIDLERLQVYCKRNHYDLSIYTDTTGMVSAKMIFKTISMSEKKIDNKN